MSLARSSLVFAVGTFFSRISGLLRDVVVTHLLGASALNDAFIIAQRIPNLLRDMLAEGALGSSFTKVFTALKDEDSEAAEILLFQMLYFALTFTGLIVVVGIQFAPQLVRMMNLSVSDNYSLDPVAVELTRLLFPSLSLTVIGAIAMGALYQRGKFFFNAVVPVIANLGVILGGVYFSEWLIKLEFLSADEATLAPVYGLALGTVLGFFLQTIFSLWAVKGLIKNSWKKFLFRYPWSPQIKKVMVLMLPAAIAGSAGPINSLINTNFATSIGQGAVTWLNYAFRLVQLPVGIFGVAVGVYALPALTRAVTRAGKRVDHQVSQELQDATLFVLWLLTPCMLFSLVYSQAIIDLIFGHGKYTAADVDATAKCLFMYSLSIVSYGLIKVLTSFYYAIDKTSYAMKVSLSGIIGNLLFNFLLVKQWEHVGLALTSSITLSLNALWLFGGTVYFGVKWNWRLLAKNVFILLSAGLLFYCISFVLGGSLNSLLEHWLPKADTHLEWVIVKGYGKKIIDLVQLISGLALLVTCFAGFALLFLKKPKKS